MNSKWTGLVVLCAGVASVCLAICWAELSEGYKIVLCVLGVLFGLTGYGILRKESKRVDERIDKQIEQKRVEEGESARYVKKQHLLTYNEKVLHEVLGGLYGADFIVLPQIALVSLVDKISRNSFRNELFRVVDFVIADANYVPLVAIELNDRSHLRSDRAERDKKVAEILQKAELPLVTIALEELQDVSLIKKKITRFLR